MTVLITKQDGTLTDDMYVCCGWNAGWASNTSAWMFLNYTQGWQFPFTPSIASNITWFIAWTGISAQAEAIWNEIINYYIEEVVGAVTIDFNTDVFTRTAHWLVDGDLVSFSYWTIPTGMVAWRDYYVINATANTFKVSLTPWGASINMTTAWATVLVWKAVRSVSKTVTQIVWATASAHTKNPYYGTYLIEWTLDTPLAVTATASKYRLRTYSTTTFNTIISALGSWTNATLSQPVCYIYTDTVQTGWVIDNDVLVMRHYTAVNKNRNPWYVYWAALSSTWAHSIVICSNINNIDADNMSYMRRDPAVSCKINLDMYWHIVLARFSWMDIWTETVPIPYANRAWITWPTWGNTPWITVGDVRSFTNSWWRYGFWWQIRIFWEKRDTGKCYATAGTAVWWNTLTVDSVPASWIAWDKIVVGKRNTTGQMNNVSSIIYTIQSIVWDVITLTWTIATASVVSWATIFKLWTTTSWTYWVFIDNVFYLWVAWQSSFVIDWADLWSDLTEISAISVHYRDINKVQYDAWHIPWRFEIKNVNVRTTAASSWLVTNWGNPMWWLMDNVNVLFWSWTNAILTSWYNTTFMPNITIKNSSCLFQYSPSWYAYSTTKNLWHNIINCRIENNSNSIGSVGWTWIRVIWDDVVIENNYIRWLPSVSAYQAITFCQINWARLKNNTIENCAYAYWNWATTIGMDILSSWDTIIWATSFFGAQQLTYTDIEFANLTTNNTLVDWTYYETFMKGSKIVLNNVNNDGLIKTYVKSGEWVRCWDGQSDTTAYTVGPGKYSLRWEPKFGGHIWNFPVPTGNIQWQNMVISIRLKINSANYYTWVENVLPTLTVKYDNELYSVSSIAQQTTEWQMLQVSFTPTTDYWEIRVEIWWATKATGSNAYMYFDDMSIQYPAWYQLNLWGLDIFARGLPVTPPLAITGASASDVWTYPTNVLMTTGTTGKALDVINTWVKKASKLIPHSQEI